MGDLIARGLASKANLQIGNLFNPSTIIKGFLVNGDGLLVNASYATTEFIMVEPSKQYFITNVRSLSFFDDNKVFIGGSLLSYLTPRNNLLVRAPSNAKYIRVSSAVGNMENNILFSINKIKSPSKWLSKIWGALGDSITQGAVWQPYVQESLGVVHYNYGVAGTKVADTSGTDTTAMCRDERINLINAQASLITVMGGTNDWAQGVPIGTINDSVTSTYAGALATAIKKIITRFPTARLVLITPPYGMKPSNSGWTDTTGLKNNLGLTTGDYGDMMKQVAKLYGVPVIDSYGNCGWNSINIASYITNDGAYLHPNDAGGKRLAEVVIGCLKNIEPIT